MSRRHRITRVMEVFLLSFIWLVLLLTPVLFREANGHPLWQSMLKQLEILLPLSVLFVINRFILVPGLLYKRKYAAYVIAVFGTIGLLTAALYLYHGFSTEQARLPREREQPEADRGKPGQPGPPPGKEDHRPPPPAPSQPQPAPPYANFLILSFLIVGFDTGLRSTLRWTVAEQERIKLEKENVDTRLVMLRNQVSPHFFMNTLNNIHALVDINTEEAKEALIKLSKMMRYLLYETDTGKTSLKKEMEFLRSYVDLMKLRFNENVRITLSLPSTVPDKIIPSFLFTSLVENAFKHGISYQGVSFIHIDLTFGADRMILVVKNSKSGNAGSKEFSGIGIGNTIKRLDLIYGDTYHIDMVDSQDMFTVNLSIPL